MHLTALRFVIASSALSLLFSRAALADCAAPTGCVDAEPLWLSPSAVRFNVVSDADALPAGKLGLGAGFMFRLRPAVLNVPAPNQNGRDVNLVSHAMSASLGARWGLGNRLELTALVAGLSQAGAGIKGVTSQSAPPITSPALQDPRLGFGFSLTPTASRLSAKIRFETKLPLGHREALAGEASLVASPSVALASRLGGWFAGLELGLRLRKPAEFLGLRLGSQASVAAGVGYELAPTALSFSLEAYATPTLIDSGSSTYIPAEWLGTARFAPRLLGNLSVGLGAGGGLPLAGSDHAQLAFGVPALRGLAFFRVAPRAD